MGTLNGGLINAIYIFSDSVVDFIFLCFKKTGEGTFWRYN